jgi:CRP-like cAMP-binding protein
MSTTGDFSKWLAYASRILMVERGSTVIAPDDRSETMYIVKTGCLDIRLGEEVLETVTAGGIVGEMALVETAPRMARVVAREDSELMPLDRRHFLFLVQETPTFALEVMAVFARRLRHMNERVRVSPGSVR